MKTKKEIKSAASKAAKEAAEWEKRRAWEAAWREKQCLAGAMFRIEDVVVKGSAITGGRSIIMTQRGFKKIK